MTNAWKKLLSLLLAVVMAFGFLPVNAFASGTDAEIVEESVAATESVVEESTTATEPAVEESTAATEPAVEESTAATEPAVEESTAATEPAVEENTDPTEPSVEEGTDPTEPAVEETVEPEETEPEIVTQTMTIVPDVSGLPSDAELFAGYVDSQFYGGGTMLLGTAARDELTGTTRLAYDALVPCLREIANGERSSTVISIELPDGELDFSQLLDALLADLPYELYWFDKTASTGYSYSYSSADTAPRFVFSFPVSEPYRGVDGDSFSVDTAKTGAASRAAANAWKVVEQYAAKKDYDKLVAYRDWICGAVSYNYDAASSGNFSGNSDPWQLIYVFDGDSGTNVVCEGYSKAFQYLCDLSAFNADITCYSVSGLMSGGGHMWNIVDIDGARYLADVTNSDSGAVGCNGGLFLVGGKPGGDGSYTFIGHTFTYDDATKALWGADILTLAESDYDPSAQGETGNEAQDRLEAALAENVDGSYTMEESVTLSRDLRVDLSSTDEPFRNVLQIPSGVTLTVPSGVTLTADTVIGLNGGALVIESGGALAANSYINLMNGGVLTVADGSEIAFGGAGAVLIQQNDGSKINGTVPKAHLVAQSRVSDLAELKAALNLDLTNYASHDVFLSGGSVTVTEDLAIPATTKLNLTSDAVLTIGAQEKAVTVVNNGHIAVTPGTELIVTPGSTLQNNLTIYNWGTLTGIVKGEPVVSANACGYNLVWRFEEETGTLIISGTSEDVGCIEMYGLGQAPWYDLREQITTIDIQAGTYISDGGAFYDLHNVTEVKLPRTLVSFENEFIFCDNLTTFSFPNGNDHGFYTNSEGTAVLCAYASSGTHLHMVAPNTSGVFAVPEEVSVIHRLAFKDCAQLTYVILSQNVREIQERAFLRCSGLTVLEMPDSVAQIGSSAFDGCDALEWITFTGDAPYLSENAFSGLSTVTVDYFGDRSGWKELTGSDYGAAAVVWEDLRGDRSCGDSLYWSFDDASGTLTFTGWWEDAGSIGAYNAGEAPWYDLRDQITTIDMQAGTAIGDNAFYGLDNVTTMRLPRTLRSFENAFGSCPRLTTFLFPYGNDHGFYTNSEGTAVLCAHVSYGTHLYAVAPQTSGTFAVPEEVSAIHRAAFKDCAQLTDITLSQNVQDIQDGAFTGCSGLTALTMPGSVARIGASVFQGCTGLTRLTFTGDAPYLSEDAFVGLSAVTVDYPGDKKGWKELTGSDFGGTVAWVNHYSIAISDTNPTELTGGKSVTLKASLVPANLTKTTVVWSLKDPADSAYATLTTAGKLTAKSIQERRTVTVVAASKDGQAVPAEWTVELIPKAKAVEIFWAQTTPVTGKTVEIDLNDADLTDLILTASLLPEGAKQGVTWKVSDTKGQYVTYREDDTGALTLTPAGKTGSITVTATAGDGSGKSGKVTVKLIRAASSIEIGDIPAGNLLQSGKSVSLTTNLASDKSLTDKRVLWSLDEDDLAFATVSNGKVTAKNVYEDTTITVHAAVAAHPEIVASCELTLKPTATAVRIYAGGELTGKSTVLPLSPGDSLTLEGGCIPEDAFGSGTWKVSGKIATIDPNGVLTANPGVKGTVTVTYSFGGKSASVKVLIGKPVTEITVTQSTEQLTGGKKFKFAAQTNDDADVKKLTWKLKDPGDSAYASVSGSTLTAKKVWEPHTVTLLVISNDYAGSSRELSVDILPADENLLVIRRDETALNGQTLSVEPGEVIPLEVTNAVLQAESVTWTVKDPKNASVEDNVVTVSSSAKGQIVLTAATADKRSAKVTLKVITKVREVTVASRTGEDTLASGKSLKLVATTNPDATTKAVTWKVAPEDAAYASVNSGGALKAAANLTEPHEVKAYALAKDGSGVESEPFAVTVYPIGTAVSIYQGQRCVNALNLPGTGEMQLTARVFPNNAQQKVVWTSSSPKVAAIDGNGNITVFKSGKVTFTAKAADGSGKSAKVTYTFTVE